MDVFEAGEYIVGVSTGHLYEICILLKWETRKSGEINFEKCRQLGKCHFNQVRGVLKGWILLIFKSIHGR